MKTTRPNGFTLVEILITTAIIGLTIAMIVAAGQFFLGEFYQTILQSRMEAQVNLGLAYMVRDIREAQRLEPTDEKGEDTDGTRFTVALPAIDANSVILPGLHDLVHYEVVEGDGLWRTVYPAAGSSRTFSDRIVTVAPAIAAMTIRYDNQDFATLGKPLSAVKNITISATGQFILRGKATQREFTTSASMRNQGL